MKIVSCVLLLAALQGRLLYEDQTNSVRVYNYLEGSGRINLETGDFTFEIKGRPAITESRLDGLTIKASSQQGVLASDETIVDPQTKKKTTQKGFIKSLAVEGEATLLLDSQVMYETRLEHSKLYNSPVPQTPTSHEVITLRTASFRYTGDREKGTATIPQAFTIDSSSKGKNAKVSFEQTLIASGTAGEIGLDPNSKKKVPLQKGSISGPVNITLDRTEIPLDAKQAPSAYKMFGVANKIEFDLAETRTITLIGNVKVRTEGAFPVKSWEGDKVVVTLNEDLKPIDISTTGNPVISRLRVGKTGGGGK